MVYDLLGVIQINFETIFGYLHTSGITIMKFNKNPKNTKNSFFSKCLLPHGVLCVFVSFCVLVFVRAIFTRHFVMVSLNLTYLHCLQLYFFEHLFNLYSTLIKKIIVVNQLSNRKSPYDL